MSFTSDTLLLFGATGDLSQRMLLPSLCALNADGLVSGGLRIIGTARSAHDDASFRSFAGEALERYLPDERKGAIPGLLARLGYQALDASHPDGFGALAGKVGAVSDGLAIFLSTAPSLFEPTIAGLAQAGLAGERVRIGLEKPLGTDLATSRQINDAVSAAFPEERIFRIDHYLGKETVQNLLALRFANILFEPLWNAAHIEHVQITVAETVGLEGRVVLAGYVPDDELRHLYSRAYALVQPSLMEGFGLPAVEAMACGIPVISSRAGSLNNPQTPAAMAMGSRNGTSTPRPSASNS